MVDIASSHAIFSFMDGSSGYNQIKMAPEDERNIAFRTPIEIEAILDMPPPKSLPQLRSLQGRLAYIRRFISNLSGRYQPFSVIAKKDTKFVWDQKCHNAFDDIKQYLSNSPVLAALVPRKPLILYTAALYESLGALLAQVNDEGKENALYYLSRRLLPTEIRCPSIENHCLALVFAAQKLRHYILSHPISLILRVNPLHYLMTQPTLSGCLAHWSMILLQFEITFIPLRAVKGRVVANFSVAHPLPADSPLNDDLPDEQIMSLRESREATWELYFDGAASSRRNATQQSIIPRKARVGLIFITPEKGMLHFSYHLSEPCTNNEAEYEALIIGLELAILMEIKMIKIFGDSQLVINQVAGTYKVLNLNHLKYHQYTLHLLEQIPIATLYRVPRGSNYAADALAKLAKEFACPEKDSIPIEIQGRKTLSPINLEHISKNPFQVLSASSMNDEEGDWR
ncbi:putative mitochondrial protein [Dendrobium catenatum]|uniref:Putative mitochondrial protein n=1 Tax=Dendrobium catenatum TaxID=906689 RepID=A0A2I0X323_9ASPA|nr:putative mitochondrial protein [Dendrobium catenatum]